jgi:anaphase-promoting complex subunit 5
MDVQWLMAVVYQNMGMTKPSVEAFKRHFNTMETRKKTEQVVVDEEVVEVWKLVVDVGSALASR